MCNFKFTNLLEIILSKKGFCLIFHDIKIDLFYMGHNIFLNKKISMNITSEKNNVSFLCLYCILNYCRDYRHYVQ